jgi:hypothetical protein
MAGQRWTRQKLGDASQSVPEGKRHRNRPDAGIHRLGNGLEKLLIGVDARPAQFVAWVFLSTDVTMGPPGDMRKGSPVQPSVIAAYNPWWSISPVGRVRWGPAQQEIIVQGWEQALACRSLPEASAKSYRGLCIGNDLRGC